MLVPTEERAGRTAPWPEVTSPENMVRLWSIVKVFSGTIWRGFPPTRRTQSATILAKGSPVCDNPSRHRSSPRSLGVVSNRLRSSDGSGEDEERLESMFVTISNYRVSSITVE